MAHLRLSRVFPVLFPAILVVGSARAAAETPPGPFDVTVSALGDGGRLVVAPRPSSASVSVCTGPLAKGGDDATKLELARRGAEESFVAPDGAGIWCVSLPPAELELGLWVVARTWKKALADVTSNEKVPPEPAADPENAGHEEAPRRGGCGASDEDIARARAIAVEGARDGAPPPARSVVTVAGAVDASAAQTLATRLFGAATEPPARDAPLRPVQTTERMTAMEGDVPSPRARYGWLTPLGSDDAAGIRVALEILGGGDRARLPKLFSGTHLGRRADTWQVYLPGGSLSGLLVEPAPRVSIDRLRRFVDGALKQLRLVGPSRKELARAKGRLLLEAYSAWSDPLALARLLSTYDLCRGGAERAPADVAALRDIGILGVSRAVRRGLTDARRTTVEIYPPLFPADDARVENLKLYTVAAGDTLAKIAERFHVTIAAIARANDLDPKYGVSEGQPLWIPK